MTGKFVAVAALVGVAAVATTGCSVDRGDRALPGSARVVAERASGPGPKTCDPMGQSLDDAREPAPGLLGDERVLTEAWGEQEAGVIAIAESGEVMLEVGRADTSGGAWDAPDVSRLHPGTLEIYDPVSGDVEQVRSWDEIDEETQTNFAAFDEDWVVWTQILGTQLAEAEWTLLAANRETGEIHEVATADPFPNGTHPTAPGYTIPELNDARVYWAAARPVPDRARGDAVIYSRALDRDEPMRLEAEDAAMPAPTDNWLYYVSRTSEVMRKNTDTGKTVEIADPEAQPIFLAASGNTVAWVGEDFTTHVYTGKQRMARIVNSAWVDHTEDGEIARIRPSWIEVGPNSVGFVDGHETGGTYLFDLTTNCLYMDELERAVATDYRFPTLTSCSLIGHAFNDTYLLRTETDRFIGRIYLNGKYYINDSADFLFELHLLEFVRDRGVSVAAPVRRRNGALLGQLPGHDRDYAIFEYAAGEQAETVDLNQARGLGTELARFHRAADDFVSRHHRYELGVGYLLEQPYALIQRERDNGSPDVDENLAELAGVRPLPELIDVVRGLPGANGAYGIIHADLHPHNAHFDGDTPTLFDFDHCAYGWRAYDVAVMGATMHDEAWKAALAGYESVRPLSRDEHAALPALVDVRNIWDPGDILAMRAAWEGR